MVPDEEVRISVMVFAGRSLERCFGSDRLGGGCLADDDDDDAALWGLGFESQVTINTHATSLLLKFAVYRAELGWILI